MASNAEEQSFSIQPHPGSTNDPNTDPALKERSSQLTSHTSLLNPGAEVHAQPGPHVPSQNKLAGLEVQSSEELDKRTQELNKKL